MTALVGMDVYDWSLGGCKTHHTSSKCNTQCGSSKCVFSGLFLNLFLAESWRMTRTTETLRVLVGRRKDAGVCGGVSLVG